MAKNCEWRMARGRDVSYGEVAGKRMTRRRQVTQRGGARQRLAKLRPYACAGQ